MSSLPVQLSRNGIRGQLRVNIRNKNIKNKIGLHMFISKFDNFAQSREMTLQVINKRDTKEKHQVTAE